MAGNDKPAWLDRAKKPAFNLLQAVILTIVASVVTLVVPRLYKHLTERPPTVEVQRATLGGKSYYYLEVIFEYDVSSLTLCVQNPDKLPVREATPISGDIKCPPSESFASSCAVRCRDGRLAEKEAFKLIIFAESDINELTISLGYNDGDTHKETIRGIPNDIDMLRKHYEHYNCLAEDSRPSDLNYPPCKHPRLPAS